MMEYMRLSHINPDHNSNNLKITSIPPKLFFNPNTSLPHETPTKINIIFGTSIKVLFGVGYSQLTMNSNEETFLDISKYIKDITCQIKGQVS